MGFNVISRSSPDEPSRQLRNVIDPILDTAEVADLPTSHRAATWNALCAIVDKCQATNVEHIQDAIQDDVIWIRLLEIYLKKSEHTKGKSNRQMLLTLTSVILKNKNLRSEQLRNQAVSIFVDVIQHRRDRLQIKPALQGLAHFLQKDIISIADLIELYRREITSGETQVKSSFEITQDILRSFLSWVIYHDTALAAGHLIKNFLGSLRRSAPLVNADAPKHSVSPLWIEPVVETLHTWQDRIQEFKTHVFPYCFLPNIEEYLRFLSYLHFHRHMHTNDPLPDLLKVYDERKNELDGSVEFTFLLAALQSGKEIGIIKDVGELPCRFYE